MERMSGMTSFQNTDFRDAEFQKISRAVASNVHKIFDNANQMQKMVNQLGSSEDSESFKSELHNLQHYTKTLSTDTKDKLKELKLLLTDVSPLEQKQQKLFLERLTNDFTAALNKFQSIQRTEAEREKEQMKQARTRSMGIPPPPHAGAQDDFIPLEPTGSQRGAEVSAFQQQQFIEEDADLQVLQDREASINRLEEDIRDVNDIFKDLATLVHAQGEVVDSIESSIENAEVRVEDGLHELQKASQYQTKARKKLCLIISIAVIILLVLILVIYFSSN